MWTAFEVGIGQHEFLEERPMPLTARAQNNMAESTLETRSFHNQHCPSQLLVCRPKLGTIFSPSIFNLWKQNAFSKRGHSVLRLPSGTLALPCWQRHCAQVITDRELGLDFRWWVAATTNKRSLVMLQDSEVFENAEGKMKHKPVHSCILALKQFSPQSGK